jgi:hypothetical protein
MHKTYGILSFVFILMATNTFATSINYTCSDVLIEQHVAGELGPQLYHLSMRKLAPQDLELSNVKAIFSINNDAPATKWMHNDYVNEYTTSRIRVLMGQTLYYHFEYNVHSQICKSDEYSFTPTH